MRIFRLPGSSTRLIGVVACLILAGGGTYFVVGRQTAVPVQSIKIVGTPDRIERGRYLYNLANCDGCHSPRDWSRFGGPVIESRRGEGVEFPKEAGVPGRVVAGNITPDPETGLGNWSDGEKLRAIRDGIGRDGRVLFRGMPSRRFRKMSDQDAYSLIAYLNTFTPIKRPHLRTSIRFPENLLMLQHPSAAGTVPQPDRTDRVEYGRYLVTVAGCGSCHTAPSDGDLRRSMRFAGGRPFLRPGASVVSTNITPDPQSGIGRWSEDEFVDRMTLYRDYAESGSPAVGPENFTVMPWLPYSQILPEDLRAIYAFLRSQKPVYQVVNSHPAGEPHRPH
jgi:mono/diheme cytochrome c family protein